MKDRKGQALIEFILIIPIFILLFTTLIDLTTIFKTQYTLQNDLDYLVDLYREKKTDEMSDYTDQMKIEVNYQSKDKETTIEVSKKVTVMTPGLNLIFKNPYAVTVKRVIYHE